MTALVQQPQTSPWIAYRSCTDFSATTNLVKRETSENCMLAAMQKVGCLALALFALAGELALNAIGLVLNVPIFILNQGHSLCVGDEVVPTPAAQLPATSTTTTTNSVTATVSKPSTWQNVTQTAKNILGYAATTRPYQAVAAAASWGKSWTWDVARNRAWTPASNFVARKYGEYQAYAAAHQAPAAATTTVKATTTTTTVTPSTSTPATGA